MEADILIRGCTLLPMDGKMLMEGREVKTLGEEDVMERAKETALDLLAR